MVLFRSFRISLIAIHCHQYVPTSSPIIEPPNELRARKSSSRSKRMLRGHNVAFTQTQRSWFIRLRKIQFSKNEKRINWKKQEFQVQCSRDVSQDRPKQRFSRKVKENKNTRQRGVKGELKYEAREAYERRFSEALQAELVANCLESLKNYCLTQCHFISLRF